MPADGHIHHGVFEHVPDVKRTRHIGRSDDNGESPSVFSGKCVGLVNAGLDPPLSPMRLKALGLVDLLKLHGSFQRNIR